MRYEEKEAIKEHRCNQCGYYGMKDPFTPEAGKDCHWIPSEDEEERPCERGEK